MLAQLIIRRLSDQIGEYNTLTNTNSKKVTGHTVILFHYHVALENVFSLTRVKQKLLQKPKKYNLQGDLSLNRLSKSF